MTDPYSRLYWSVMDDPKFDGVREDVRLFGSWSLLLVVADMAWPAPAFVPPMVPKAAVAKLAEARLIDLLPGQRYRVHGLASEREKRAQSGRNAAALRWQKVRNADPMLDEAETRRDEAETRSTPPPSPAKGRSNGTNPRSTGSNPRARGSSPRQVRDAEKRSPMPQSVHDILRRAASGEKA